MDMSGVSSFFFYHSGIQNGNVVVTCEWPTQTETDRRNFDTDATSWPAQVACGLNFLYNQRIFSFLSWAHAHAGTNALKIKVSLEIFVPFLWFNHWSNLVEVRLSLENLVTTHTLDSPGKIIWSCVNVFLLHAVRRSHAYDVITCCTWCKQYINDCLEVSEELDLARTVMSLMYQMFIAPCSK